MCQFGFMQHPQYIIHVFWLHQFTQRSAMSFTTACTRTDTLDLITNLGYAFSLGCNDNSRLAQNSMKMKLILAMLTAMPLLGLSQSITPQVVSSAGGEFFSDEAGLTWTLGESVSTTLLSDEHMITQGFHQTWLTVTAIIDRSAPAALQVSVYPNPTAHMLHIRMNGDHAEMDMVLSDLNGKELIRQRIQMVGGTSSIDLTGLAMSTYLLNVSTIDAKHQKTFRIVKTAQ
jgi:hypothetical protein